MSVTALAWSYLILAGVLESFWAMGLKLCEGFTKPLATIVTIILLASSFFLLSKSMNVLPASIAYPVWCAIGIVGIVLVEYLYLNTSINLQKTFAIFLILIGIFILKVS